MNIRHRRGTTTSNLSGPSNQASKEETFETSSFFDERSGSNRASNFVNQAIAHGSSPHKCN